MAKLLIVDDDRATVDSLVFIFRKANHDIFTAYNGKEAINILKEHVVDLVLTDLMMPEIDGHDLLKIIRNLKLQTSVILMTAYGSVETAVSVFKEGAEDFIVKPLKKAVVVKAVEKALANRALMIENKALRAALDLSQNRTIIGQAPAFKKVMDEVAQVAGSPSTVLIYGESGTGKELIAKEIHRLGGAQRKVFIPVNLAALPESIIESELFGYVKGAFTGASGSKKGYLESADGGTLFLDEVSELPQSIQVKLLRFLQEGEVTPLGETKSIKVNCRVIAATNKPLEKLVPTGQFREDLYYRLSVIPMTIPPLRLRREDIPDLVAHFLQKQLKRQGKVARIEPEVVTVLMSYNWPGNVRELEHLIERLVVFSDQMITMDMLPEQISQYGSTTLENEVVFKLGTSMSEVEQIFIQRTLEFARGDKELAAKILGISLRSIYRKI